MKKMTTGLIAAMCCLLLGGCSAGTAGSGTVGSGAAETGSGENSAIPFEDGQCYAVAYLGYQEINDLELYTEEYMDGAGVPVHYLSSGDYYLVIPRYPDMAMSLYLSDIETMEPSLVYEDPACGPFIVQCNASDIFADTTIRLTWQGEQVEFSPFISLKDGSVDVGEKGLDITRTESGG